jgi:RimJ/RimL family protein N-acetyltransferase
MIIQRNEPAATLCAIAPVDNHRDGRHYELTPVSLVVADELAVRDIVAACNEPQIYRILFESLLGGRPYGEDDAWRFLEWGEEGWSQGSRFAYVLADEAGAIVGAIDIKSADLESAEIGYWLSAAHTGAMTNTVCALCELARRAGYHALHALVLPGNTRSAAVLLRAGFERSGQAERNGRVLDRFERRLANAARPART